MQKGTLKTWRFIVPPVIFFSLLFIVSRILGFTNIKPPSNPKDVIYNIPYLAIAVIYYISPLRSWANGVFHKRVNENLRIKLLSIAGVQDDPDRFSWARVKDVFYRRIDSDPSLKERSGDIMANGLIWSSLADLTALSVMFFVATIGLWIAGIENAPDAAVVMAGIALASRMLQDVVTTRHIQMGDDQVRYIAQFQQEVLAEEIRNL